MASAMRGRLMRRLVALLLAITAVSFHTTCGVHVALRSARALQSIPNHDVESASSTSASSSMTATVTDSPTIETTTTSVITTAPPAIDLSPVETAAPPVTGSPPEETPAPPMETTSPPVETPPPPVETTAPPASDPPPAETNAPPTIDPPPIEMTAPPVTGSPPEETPAPPMETTSPPVETPPPPVETTAPPASDPPPAETNAPPTIDPPPIEMTAPPVTGSPPEETPAPPVETTSPPVETPAPPVETTSPPVETPSPPVETTAPPASDPPPAETNAPPTETTAPPVETPAPPVETTAPLATDPPFAETTAPSVETSTPPLETTAPLPATYSPAAPGSDQPVTDPPPIETPTPTVEKVASPVEPTAPPLLPAPLQSETEPALSESPPVLTTTPPQTMSPPVVPGLVLETPSDDPPAVRDEPLTNSLPLNPLASTISNEAEPLLPNPAVDASTAKREESPRLDEENPTSSTSPWPLTTSALPLIYVPIANETNAPLSSSAAEAFAKKDELLNITPIHSPQDSDADDWETAAQPEKYIRGQTSIEDTIDPWRDLTGNHSNNSSPHIQPLIIGGKNRGTASVAGTPYAETGTNFHHTVRQIASVISATSVVLLLAFHFVSLDSTLKWPSSAWSPNAWEFGVFVMHLQQMTSLSELTLLRSPFFLWDFTDAFAWTRFLVQRTIQTPHSGRRRRLDTVLILDGLVGFADRIGLNETKLLRLTATGFAITMGALLFCVGIAAAIAYRCRETSTRDRAASIAYRLLGLCGLIWFFSLYPLSIMASFEITMEIYSNSLNPSLLALAILTIAVGCVFVLALIMRTVLHKTEVELRDYKHIAVFGAFYLDTRYKTRLFFVLGASVQLATGLSIGVLNSNLLLLSILIGIHGLYLLAIVGMRPFSNNMLRTLAFAGSLLAIINFSISFAFLRGTIMPLKRRVAFANVFIAINTIVLLLWFARHLVLFVNTIKAVLCAYIDREPAPVLSYPEIAKLRAQAVTMSVAIQSDRMLEHPSWRVDWSRSMSLSGSSSMTWGNDFPAARARAAPRTAYTAVSDV